MKNYSHQDREYARYRYAVARALWWQPRTGKTRAVVRSADALHEALEIYGALVIAPNGVHRHWYQEEIAKHENRTSAKFMWRMADPNNDKKFDAWMTGLRPGVFAWLCVNMQALPLDKTRRAITRFKKFIGRGMLVADESHHFSRPGTKRTAAIRGWARLFEYRRDLSGTSSEESPLQLFSQYEILGRGLLGHETYGSFKNEFATYDIGRGAGGRRFPKLVGYRNLDKLRRRMAPYTSVVLRRDCPDLPPVIEVTRMVELSEEQKRMWRMIKEKELEALDAEEYTGPISGAPAFVKLQQIEGAWLIGDEGPQRIGAENPKVLILIDEIMQYAGQVIVWHAFTHELEDNHMALTGAKIPCARYHGKMRSGEREDQLQKFRRGEYKVMLATPQSIGEGRGELGVAGMIIWHSQTASATTRTQANERGTVMGGDPVQIVNLIAPGGVDERWRKITTNKSVVAESMTREGLRKVLSEMNV